MAPVRLAKAFHVGGFGVLAAISAILGATGMLKILFSERASGVETGVVLIFVASALSLAAYVFLLTAVYQIWDALQGGVARTRPGGAIGFLFVPFYNLYWVFQAYWGWAKDYNATVELSGLELRTANPTTPMVACVVLLCTGLPLVGVVAQVAFLVLMLKFLSDACDRVNALGRALVLNSTEPHPPEPRSLSKSAVLSLACALGGFVSCGVAGIAGFVLGILSFSSIRKSEGLLYGKGLAIAGLAISGASLLCLPLAFMLILPAVWSTHGQAENTVCENRLRQLHRGAMEYALHSIAFPLASGDSPRAHESLNVLLESRWGRDLSPDVFVCPAGEAVPARRTRNGRLTLRENNLSYAWVARRTKVTIHRPLACDKYVHGYRDEDGEHRGHQGYIHVLYTDGSVRTLPVPDSGQPFLPEGLTR